MDVSGILNTGVQGFQDAASRANKAAQEIASQSVEDASQAGINQQDLTSSIVDLKVAEIDARASVEIIETASDLVGTLLDVKA
ncbi:flagellar biosynthesis protein FlgE [Aliikangiella marina]|uniref:Flagellar biosynthesis protein FlgE n=1 Tax=Aliikangiella marina TaxID=1712262 RepID=A0A545T6V0_9GAMM|nr:flagellar biosynthesis protein FlgE [Aliikangiella marina]TQV72946.1 flagellar biosynthesis protein FlgE [Aliikangiella marina]